MKEIASIKVRDRMKKFIQQVGVWIVSNLLVHEH